jgi:hypothetical protein
MVCWGGLKKGAVQSNTRTRRAPRGPAVLICTPLAVPCELVLNRQEPPEGGSWKGLFLFHRRFQRKADQLMHQPIRLG